MHAAQKLSSELPEVRGVQVGLIGSGIQKSLTPAMHMREGREHGLRYAYELFDLSVLRVGVESLPELIRQAEEAGYAGLNITHPCKQAAIQFVDELSGDASTIGAINTIVFRKGRRIGHNTDWWGFFEGVRRRLPDADVSELVLLGAGGAGVAIAHALALMGGRVLHVYDIARERAEALKASLEGHHPGCRIAVTSDLPAVMGLARGVVNATPIGMNGHPGLPLDVRLLRPTQWVAEVVYFPLVTQFLSEARRMGCLTVDGGGMAVFQAVKAFELFTGVRPDAERMAAHFEQLCGAGAPSAQGV